MIQASTMLYLYVETPLHAGTGSSLSSIDLPIQRERSTQYPMIQATGIKGKLRATAADLEWSSDELHIVFGPEQGDAHAGALIVGDARLLLFPVRSLSGVFAYTTSPLLLQRFFRDVQRFQTEELAFILPTTIAKDTAQVPSGSDVIADNTLLLEDMSYQAEANEQVAKIAEWIAEKALPAQGYTYWKDKIKRSLVILPNDDFNHFMMHATEVMTRIRLKTGTKTVDGGALWTEEHLPSDTLLYVPIYATHSRKPAAHTKQEQPVSTLQTAEEIIAKTRNLEDHQHGYIQLGGDETTGRGLVRMHWTQPQTEKQEVK